ncbi:hypothetical protein Taro_036569 [Colocasia esculenta]|uniref:Uncharacterized protein n=1 Tax=Colocasia esculenta TaxID=4460 RepID=A0A843WDR2_COLES|nr:hypothetical protein [Colocasia esculenta]
MSPSGLLKATGPMSPSHVQRVKCSGREHKPQFVSLLGEGFSSDELRLADSVGGLGGRPWCSFARWRHIDALPLGTSEGDSIYVATLVATWGPSPSSCFLFPASVPVSLADLLGETSQQFPPRHSKEMGPQ